MGLEALPNVVNLKISAKGAQFLDFQNLPLAVPCPILDISRKFHQNRSVTFRNYHPLKYSWIHKIQMVI